MLRNFILFSPCFEFGAATSETIAISHATKPVKLRPGKSGLYNHVERRSAKSTRATLILSIADTAAASRPLPLLELLAQRGLAAPGLLDIGREILELLHLANLDHFVVRSGAALRPFDRLFLGLHLDHPIPADHFLRFRESPLGHLGSPSRHPTAHPPL